MPDSRQAGAPSPAHLRWSEVWDDRLAPRSSLALAAPALGRG